MRDSSARIQAEDSAMCLRSSARSFRRKKVTLDHPIFSRWPAQYPDRLQLFSAPTPNGVKVGIMLEETNLAYEPHRIDIMAAENHDPAYLADKTGQSISADPNTRYETIQWVMWQMGGVGPMFGQVGFFNKFAGKAY